MRLQVKIKKLEFGIEEWGMIDIQTHQKYYPINMPEQLKKSDVQVNVIVQPETNAFTSVMWGQAVKIIGFSTP